MGLVSGLDSVPQDQRLNGAAVELASVLLNATPGWFTVGSLQNNCCHFGGFSSFMSACYVLLRKATPDAC